MTCTDATSIVTGEDEKVHTALPARLVVTEATDRVSKGV